MSADQAAERDRIAREVLNAIQQSRGEGLLDDRSWESLRTAPYPRVLAAFAAADRIQEARRG